MYETNLYLCTWKKPTENRINREIDKTYSNVWKHEWLLIQSIDWKRIRDADSQIKLFEGCKSRFVDELGGVMVNTLVMSVTKGPSY